VLSPLEFALLVLGETHSEPVGDPLAERPAGTEREDGERRSRLHASTSERMDPSPAYQLDAIEERAERVLPAVPAPRSGSSLVLIVPYESERRLARCVIARACRHPLGQLAPPAAPP
jgi:hypothetical protein